MVSMVKKIFLLFSFSFLCLLRADTARFNGDLLINSDDGDAYSITMGNKQSGGDITIVTSDAGSLLLQSKNVLINTTSSGATTIGNSNSPLTLAGSVVTLTSPTLAPTNDSNFLIVNESGTLALSPMGTYPAITTDDLMVSAAAALDNVTVAGSIQVDGTVAFNTVIPLSPSLQLNNFFGSNSILTLPAQGNGVTLNNAVLINSTFPAFSQGTATFDNVVGINAVIPANPESNAVYIGTSGVGGGNIFITAGNKKNITIASGNTDEASTVLINTTGNGRTVIGNTSAPLTLSGSAIFFNVNSLKPVDDSILFLTIDSDGLIGSAAANSNLTISLESIQVTGSTVLADTTIEGPVRINEKSGNTTLIGNAVLKGNELAIKIPGITPIDDSSLHYLVIDSTGNVTSTTTLSHIETLKVNGHAALNNVAIAGDVTIGAARGGTFTINGPGSIILGDGATTKSITFVTVEGKNTITLNDEGVTLGSANAITIAGSEVRIAATKGEMHIGNTASTIFIHGADFPTTTTWQVGVTSEGQVVPYKKKGLVASHDEVDAVKKVTTKEFPLTLLFPVSFCYKKDQGNKGKESPVHLGFIVEDIEESKIYAPAIEYENTTKKPCGIQYEFFIPVLWAHLIEQEEKVAALEEAIKQLTFKMNHFEKIKNTMEK